MAATSSTIWKRRVDLLQQRCERLAVRNDGSLLKAAASLQKLKDLCSEDTDKLDISVILHLYSQAILDVTFFEENQLVDEDFQHADSLQKVRELIHTLSEPEHLLGQANLNQEALDVVVLEVDLLECLHWRKGALLYMYCHTVREREHWLLRNKSSFQQCLRDGVHHLQKMLNTRSPMIVNEEVSYQDSDTASLLGNGIFSSTHVLALMYSGEMCYWGLKYCDEEQCTDAGSECCDQSQDKSISFKDVGKDSLEKYVAVCEGTLLGHGWNTEKAKNILQFLKEERT
ncbi:RAB7A-interacting MON1-CCZ1 complex subunit 1 [Pelodytes ibericus]